MLRTIPIATLDSTTRLHPVPGFVLLRNHIKYGNESASSRTAVGSVYNIINLVTGRYEFSKLNIISMSVAYYPYNVRKVHIL